MRRSRSSPGEGVLKPPHGYRPRVVLMLLAKTGSARCSCRLCLHSHFRQAVAALAADVDDPVMGGPPALCAGGYKSTEAADAAFVVHLLHYRLPAAAVLRMMLGPALRNACSRKPGLQGLTVKETVSSKI